CCAGSDTRIHSFDRFGKEFLKIWKNPPGTSPVLFDKTLASCQNHCSRSYEYTPFDRLDCTSHKARGIGSRLDDSDSSGSRQYRIVECSHFYAKGNKYVERAKIFIDLRHPVHYHINTIDVLK